MSLQGKYEEIHEKGLKDLSQAEIPLWAGVTNAMRDNLIVAYCLDSSPLSSLLDAIARFEGRGLKLFLAGRDYPLHVTIQQGKGLTSDKADVPTIPQELQFEHLMVGPNVLLGSKTVPVVIKKARSELSSWMRDQSINPLPIDILHATVARLSGFESPLIVDEFRNELLQFREKILAMTIRLPITHVFQGTVAELLGRK